MILSIACSQSRATAAAWPTGGGKPSVEMSLRTWRKLTPSLGSPFLIHYRIVAPPDQEVAINLGEGSAQWFTLSMTDSQGNSVVELPPATRYRAADWYHRSFLPSYAYLDPNNVYDGEILVNEYFLLDHPGTYHLQVQVRLPYLAIGKIHGEPDYNVIRTATTSFSKTQSFDVVVAEATPSHVRAIAGSLLDTINSTESRFDRIQLVDALFSLPERAAQSVWQMAALSAAPTRSNASETWMFIADALARRGSLLASDLLVEMITPVPGAEELNKDREGYVLMRLGDLYYGKDPALRRHIDDALAQAGITRRPIWHL